MEQNKTLVKLLAKENITIQHGNYKTAWFDIKNRVLGLPAWADNGKDVYDLLCGHEVGHALYTPFEGWHDSPEKLEGAPRSYINVIEDARIERKIRNEYPGLVGPFLRGYKKLADLEFFGDLTDLDFDQIRVIDKINLKAKLGSAVNVPFNSEEKAFFDRAMTNETFEEVVELCKEILAYTKENQPELLEPPKMPELPEDFPPFTDEDQDNSEPPVGHDDMETPEGEETDSEQQSSNGMKESEEDDVEEEQKGESSEEGDTDEDEENVSTKGEVSATPEEVVDEDVSTTDEIFRSKECGLVETNEDGTQTLHSNGLTKDIIDVCVIDHKTLAKERLERQSRFPEIAENMFTDSKESFETYLKTSRKNVNFAVKEFEMRKAAHQWQRATTAKSGSLDVNKVHSYKYNEDIFARVTSLADSKNHGMMMIIDYSGSMCYSMAGVLDQLMHLVTFCKAVNIPFEVYAFTTGNTNFYDRDKEERNMDNLKLFKDASLDVDGLSMPLLISSDLKKADFKTAMQHLYIKMTEDSYYGAEMISSRNEDWGSTPLNQALVVSHTLIKKFKAKHNIEKMSFVCLSDGDTNHMHIYQDRKLDNKKMDVRSYGNRGINIIIENKLVKLTNQGKLGTKDLLLNLKKRYNTTNLGFFIADDARHFNNRIWSAMVDQSKGSDDYIDFYSEEWAEIKKANSAEYRKNKCVIKENALGYDEFYVVKNGKTLSTEAEDLLDTLEEDASKGKIGSAFKRMSKSKKTNKVLLTRFGKAVA